MSGTKINRMELLRLRKRKALVVQGIDILTHKKDALLEEFRTVVKSLHEVRLRLENNMNDSARALVMARAQEPDHFLATQAMAARRKIILNISMKSIWGVKWPKIDFPDARRDPFQRGTAPGYRSLAVDGAAESFEATLNTLAAAAAEEFHLLEIGGAIRKTSRRINALEVRLLPQIKKDMARISTRLEELEREDRFRLKRFKKLKQGRF